jgi:hypothetical protein
MLALRPVSGTFEILHNGGREQWSGGITMAGPGDGNSALELEYCEVNDNIRTLADVRFKLLALVPAVGGVASFLLTRVGEPSLKTTPSDYAMVIVFGVFGFLVTLGVVFYDQRNSKLYNALIKRAKELEDENHLRLKGQWTKRPSRDLKLFHEYRLFRVIIMGHDSGLALIYGPVLGIWFFPTVFSALRLLGRSIESSFRIALYVAAIAVLVFIVELLRLDETWAKIWTKIRSRGKGEEPREG